MSGKVTALYRYPVKGLSAEALSAVSVNTGQGMPLDRRFAIVHANSQYDAANPGWIERNNFAVLAHSPDLARLQCTYTDRVLTVEVADQQWRLHIDHPSADLALTDLIDRYTSDKQPGPYQLVELSQGSLTDSPEPSISIMNTRSLAAFSQRAGGEIEPARLRGNLWFDGQQPWEEREWLGQTLRVGSVRLRVTEEIIRCAAINVNPVTGGFDQNLLTVLGRRFGHTHFGVLATVVEPGRITRGDLLSLDTGNGFGALGI